MATKKKPGTSLVKWEEEMAELAQASTEGLKAGEGKFISFKGGKMSFAGADIPDDEIRCVILGWTHHNIYYDTDYDPDAPTSPSCYAFGKVEGEMAPHPAAPEPKCGSCAECPLNEFESGKQRRGKACKNTFRLALIAESDLADLDNAEVVYCSVPPTSLKNFSSYLKKDLGALQRPHWFVITELKRVPDNKAQFRLTFKHAENIEDGELYPPLKQLWQDHSESIAFPYPEREAEAPKQKAKKEEKKSKFSRR